MKGNDDLSMGDQPTQGGGDHLDVSMGDAATMRPDGGQILGRVDRYALIEKLGQGGFGAVYRALDEEAGVEVALKALPALISHSPEELDSVRRNFALVSKLVHSNIANIKHLHRVDYADPDAKNALSIGPGDYLVVMECVRGSTLSSWRHLFPNKKVPVAQSIEICRQIAEALDFAHGQKIVHRDIKPSNIMIAMRSDAGGQRSEDGGQLPTTDNQQLQTDNCTVKVLDFGLAAEIRSSMSRVSREQGDTSGTRPYMAPEQWAGRKQGAYTDQYSLAVLFYELVSGAVPFASAFETGDPVVMLNVAQNQTPEPLKELDKKQNAVLLRALAKDPDTRFGSCVEFVDVFGGGKILKPRNTPNTRKGRKALLAVAVIALVGAGGFFGVRWQAERDTALQEQVRVEQQDAATKAQIAELYSTAQQQLEAANYTEASASVAKVLKLDAQHVQALALKKEIRLKMGMEQAVPLQTSAGMELGKVRHYKENWPGHAAALERLDAELQNGATYFEQAAYGVAVESFNRVLGGVETLRVLENDRKGATTQRDAAENQQKIAKAAKADALAETDYEKGVASAFRAATLYGDGKFKEAGAAWKAAVREFKAAEVFAEGTQAVADAKAKYETVIRNTKYAISDLDRYGSTKWSAVKNAVGSAALLAKNEKWDEAVAKYKAAAEGLSGAVAEATAAQMAQRVEGYLASARKAQASKDWQAAFDATEATLALDAGNAEAKKIKTDAEQYLVPQLKVVCNVRGGTTSVSSKDGTEPVPPSGLRLKKQKTYTLTVSKKGYKTHTQELTAAWTGVKTVKVALEEWTGPEKDRKWTADLGSGVTMEFMPIKAGPFQMGSNGGKSNEKPVHEVKFTKPFWLAKTEVTQAQYQQIMGNNPSNFKGTQNPVEKVSWNDAIKFCEKLTERERRAGRLPAGFEYTLPTEAQWEYACRSRTTGDYAGNLDSMGWYEDNSGQKTHPVGTKQANAWGLCDMHGNVWEWCMDDWHGSYAGAPADGTRWGDGNGSYRVIRGGSWSFNASYCRSALRSSYDPSRTYNGLGFRPLVLQK
jgi:formylglycine-generating enzyme required for sulfatase activity/serine/threonine protein kinase